MKNEKVLVALNTIIGFVSIAATVAGAIVGKQVSKIEMKKAASEAVTEFIKNNES